MDGFLCEFWRFTVVQQEEKLAMTAVEFPPMQKGASFNLEAVKAKIQAARAAMAKGAGDASASLPSGPAAFGRCRPLSVTREDVPCQRERGSGRACIRPRAARSNTASARP